MPIEVVSLERVNFDHWGQNHLRSCMRYSHLRADTDRVFEKSFPFITRDDQSPVIQYSLVIEETGLSACIKLSFKQCMLLVLCLPSRIRSVSLQN